MRLLRLTWLVLEPATSRWESTELVSSDGIRIHFGAPLDSGDQPSGEDPARATRQLFVAQLQLSRRPDSREREIVVPEPERLRAEVALENAADTLSAASGCVRSLLTPPGFAISFLAETPEEQGWLEAHRALAGSQAGVSRARWFPRFGDDLFAFLDGREDGVALLAETISQPHESARYRELVRFFERAFSASSGRLVALLAAFLGSRPVFRYTKTEVKRWIIRLRGSIVHADKRNALLRAREMEAVTDRMLFAAYDVLLNKADWCQSNVARRPVWSPLYGPLDDQTTLAAPGEDLPIASEFRDQFGSYPMSMSFPDFTLPEPHWPRQPHEIRCEDRLTVVDREEMLRVDPPVQPPT
jgi:hypothetical protein